MSFLDSLMFNRFDNETVSLNDYSVDIQVRQRTAIRRQSIDERFNENSVKFIKTLLEQQLQKQVAESRSMVCLEKFSSVDIKDSTRFQVPSSLKNNYPGSGGNASEAGAHVHFEFDLKIGKVNAIRVTSAKHQDVTDAHETISDIKEGSLILRDLAYFSTKLLSDIATKRKAYYISRLKPAIKIFRCTNDKFMEIDLAKERTIMKRNRIAWKELDVYVGEKYKLPVRLLIELLPEGEVEARMRKAKKNAQKKCRVFNEQYRSHASLGLFITNVPKDWMEPQYIRTIYRLRWQIELRFKCWKSLFHIHKIKKMKLHRFETCLYACLLYILINWEISMSLISTCLKNKGQMLSVYKCYKAIIQCSDILRNSLFNCAEKLRRYFQKIEPINYKNLLLEKRKGRLSVYEILSTSIESK